MDGPNQCPQIGIDETWPPVTRVTTEGVAFLITQDSPDYAASRTRRFRTVTRGVRLEADANDWWDEVTAFALVLPQDAVFSHTTAAHIAGLPLSGIALKPFHVTVASTRGTRKGLVWHKRDLQDRVETYRGLRITTPGQTWHDLGGLLPLKELVVVTDHLLRQNGLTAEDLQSVPRMRHCRRLRAAAALADGRSKSPQETRIRLEMGDRGLPIPELNAEIVEDGGWIGEGDFVWREYRTIADYDGEVHLNEKQQTQDNQTRDLYAAYGWRHVALTKRMVRNMDAALERVARALRDNGWAG